MKSPSLDLLAKLGSLAIYAERMLYGKSNLPVDSAIVRKLLKDSEVHAFLDDMDSYELVPQRIPALDLHPAAAPLTESLTEDKWSVWPREPLETFKCPGCSKASRYQDGSPFPWAGIHYVDSTGSQHPFLIMFCGDCLEKLVDPARSLQGEIREAVTQHFKVKSVSSR